MELAKIVKDTQSTELQTFDEDLVKDWMKIRPKDPSALAYIETVYKK